MKKIPKQSSPHTNTPNFSLKYQQILQSTMQIMSKRIKQSSMKIVDFKFTLPIQKEILC